MQYSQHLTEVGPKELDVILLLKNSKAAGVDGIQPEIWKQALLSTAKSVLLGERKPTTGPTRCNHYHHFVQEMAEKVSLLQQWACCLLQEKSCWRNCVVPPPPHPKFSQSSNVASLTFILLDYKVA